MPKQPGRLCLIEKNGTAIAGVRNVSMTVNGSPIDVQDQGDNGFATFLDGVLIGQSIEISGDGYEEDQVLRDIAVGAASGRFLTDITLDFGNGDQISGNFVMTAYNETGPFEDGQTFAVTFQSNGAWTYTPQP